MGKAAKYYRVLYNMFALISLLPILYYHVTRPSQLIVPATWKEAFTFIGLALATYGIIFVRLAFKQFSLKKFLGLKPADSSEEVLHTQGVLKAVRHPLYFGGLLMLVGYWFFSPTQVNLITVLLLIAYLIVGAHFEEQRLVRQFGESYKKYQQQVPMLIPNFKALKKCANNEENLKGRTSIRPEYTSLPKSFPESSFRLCSHFYHKGPEQQLVYGLA